MNIKNIKINYLIFMILTCQGTSIFSSSTISTLMQTTTTSLQAAQALLTSLRGGGTASTPAQINARNQAIADKWAIDKTTNAGSPTPAQTNARNQAIADKWAIDNAIATQISTTFYNGTSNQTVVVQPLVTQPGGQAVPTGTAVTILPTATNSPSSAVVSVPATTGTVTYSVTIQNANYPALIVNYNPTTYPGGYQISASLATGIISSGITAQNPVTIQNNARNKAINDTWTANASSIAANSNATTTTTTFYNDCPNKTIQVQAAVNGAVPMVNGQPLAPVSIPYTAGGTYTSGAVTVAAPPTQVTYYVSVPGLPNFGPIPANPTTYPTGYLVTASQTAISVGGIVTPYTTATIATPFYNDCGQPMTVQAFVEGSPTGNPVTIGYTAGATYNSNTVSVTTNNGQPVTYSVSIPGHTTLQNLPYVPNTFGYQINAGNTTIGATSLTTAYSTATVNMRFYNDSSQTMTIQPLIEGSPSGTPISIDYKATMPYNYAVVSVITNNGQPVSYNVSISGRTSITVPYANIFGYEIHAVGQTISYVSLTADYAATSYSTNFYNNCGTTMVIQPYVNNAPSGQSVSIPYVKGLLTPTPVMVSALATDTITYSVFMAAYHNLNNNNQVIPGLSYNTNTAPAGYQIGISGKSITATPLTAPSTTVGT